MNKHLKQTILDNTPRFNEAIADGLATTMVPQAAEFINKLIRAGIKYTPKEFRYKGYRQLTPEENYRYESNFSKVELDLGKTDVYRIALMFEYDGQKTDEKLILLPFISDGGLMFFSGTRYTISPVLTDSVISVDKDNLFIKLFKDKKCVMRNTTPIFENDMIIEGNYFHSALHNSTVPGTSDYGSNLHTPFSLYLLIVYGFKGLKKKFIPDVDLQICTEENIKDYDLSNYNVYKSTGRRFKKSNVVTHGRNKVRILVNKKDKITDFIKTLVTEMIYVTDIFTLRSGEIVEVMNENNVTEEKTIWKLLLGEIIFKGTFSDSKVLESIDEHITKLFTYIDSAIKEKLENIKVDSNNMFELMHTIMVRYSTWIAESKNVNDNIDNKYYDILYYILYGYIPNINKMMDTVTKEHKKKGKLTIQEVNKILKDNIKERTFLSADKTLPVNVFDYSGGNKVFKVTSMASLQNKGNGVNKPNKETSVNVEPIIGPHVYLGAILNLMKKDPSVLNKINPYANVDGRKGTIHMSPEDKYITGLLTNRFTNKEESPVVDLIEDDLSDLIRHQD